jgi:hypothetical protein
MTDYRQDRSDKFKKPSAERGNPHGGRGRRAQSKLAEQFETQTGRPLGGGADTSSRRAPADAPRNADLRRAQHARKGQAQSPREANLNQPERKRKRSRS